MVLYFCSTVFEVFNVLDGMAGFVVRLTWNKLQHLLMSRTSLFSIYICLDFDDI